MKTIPLFIALLCTPAFAGHDDLQLDQCPPAVQAAIREHSRGGPVDDIDRIGIEGNMIYRGEVELPRDQELKIYVSANGALLKTVEEIALAEAPEAVRRAVQDQGGSIDDVAREAKGQIVTYHVEIDRHGQPDLDLVLDENGAILSRIEEGGD